MLQQRSRTQVFLSHFVINTHTYVIILQDELHDSNYAVTISLFNDDSMIVNVKSIRIYATS